MHLSKHIELFKQKRTADILWDIVNEHGWQSFSIACRAAGIKRGQGKRILGIYNDAGALSQIVSKACGYKTSKAFRR